MHDRALAKGSRIPMQARAVEQASRAANSADRVLRQWTLGGCSR